MGLVSEAIATELGYLTRDEGEARVRLTLETLLTHWPRDSHSGFMVHFTNRNWDALSEFSTIDTTELVLGALFAGNYFGGEIIEMANVLLQSVSWSDAIKAADKPTIFPTVNSNTGEFKGNIRPYNEYYLVAYLANLTSSFNTKANIYFETYMASHGPPKGDGNFPTHLNYYGFEVLSDSNSRFMSSFIPQFCYYLSRGFRENEYYKDEMLINWLNADLKYWSLALDESSQIWGQPVYGKVWGAGAGPGPSGYSVERIDGSPDLIISAAIMAGFLPVANNRESINNQLEWMYTNEVCAYETELPDGRKPKILWRCSVRLPDWRAPSVDSIDFSTMILGYATNFLPEFFYNTYVA